MSDLKIAKTNSSVNEQKIIELEQKIIELRKELDDKKYLIPVSKDIVDNYISFIEKDANWKYSEAVGIVQLYDDLIDAKLVSEVENIEGIMLTSTTLEAMNYFYSLTTGKGLAYAKAYLKELRPLAEGLQKAKEEMKLVDKMEFELASLKEGLEMEPIRKGTQKSDDDEITV